VRVVLVGGLDPGTGAGVARDLLTARALGAREGFLVEPREPERVRASLASALARAEPGAVKIGMVATAAIVRAVELGLGAFAGPVVYDPVLRASSGGALYDGERESILRLARRATLLTPNLAEAAWLSETPVQTPTEARAAARTLHALGIPAVLVKGGHLEGEAADVLVSATGESVLVSPRVPRRSPRGTGCALATAIAVRLAGGDRLEHAVAAAKSWLTERIARATTIDGEQHL
jgi:hydroxymethylpyrimidine/phosphomethylpyrimidine kinase